MVKTRASIFIGCIRSCLNQRHYSSPPSSAELLRGSQGVATQLRCVVERLLVYWQESDLVVLVCLDSYRGID